MSVMISQTVVASTCDPSLCDPNHPPAGFFCSMDPIIGCGLFCFNPLGCQPHTTPKLMGSKSTPKNELLAKTTPAPETADPPGTSPVGNVWIVLKPSEYSPVSITVLTHTYPNSFNNSPDRQQRQVVKDQVIHIETTASDGFEWLLHSNPRPHVFKVRDRSPIPAPRVPIYRDRITFARPVTAAAGIHRRPQTSRIRRAWRALGHRPWRLCESATLTQSNPRGPGSRRLRPPWAPR